MESIFESMAEFVLEDKDHFTSVSGCTITMMSENPGRYKILCPRCGWSIEKDDIQQLALGEIIHLSDCKGRIAE